VPFRAGVSTGYTNQTNERMRDDYGQHGLLDSILAYLKAEQRN
jgi:hypothetical protein